MKKRIVFIVLLLLSLIWYLIYESMDYNTYINNPLLYNSFRLSYSSGIPPLIGIVISFISIIHALICIWKICRVKPRNKIVIISWLIYLMFSIAMLIFNCVVCWKIAYIMLFWST